ncbi:Tyrosine-protein kinase EpsD [Streptococcus oralis]|uniref:Tyrosine-protein kinase EpsD n=1 Tax=Streptococcus oralis TaxID=1303 RepID=A0A139RPE3_STROR|nr:Tyrosine-protein kinase EpsD [Streptococcus oralis]
MNLNDSFESILEAEDTDYASKIKMTYTMDVPQTVEAPTMTSNEVFLGVFKSREKITGLTDYLSGSANLSLELCDTDIDNPQDCL